MSSGSVIFHNPAGLFTTTGMQKYPVRRDLKGQNPIYSRRAPLLPSAGPPCSSWFRFVNALSLRRQMGTVPAVSVGGKSAFKAVHWLEYWISCAHSWLAGSTGLSCDWQVIFTVEAFVFHHHNRRGDICAASIQGTYELKGAAIVKVIRWRRCGLRPKCCWIWRINDRMMILTSIHGTFACLFVCLIFFFVGRENRK